MMIDHYRVSEVRKTVNRSGLFSFEDFCNSKGLFDAGREERAGGVWIACPFHSDAAPSLSFNEEKGIWHCFGCSAGGTLVDFMYMYETVTLGKRLSRSSFYNGLLSSDERLRIRLGFGTVYSEKCCSVYSLEHIDKFKYRSGNSLQTYLGVQEELLKHNPTKEQIKAFVLMMQKGLPPRVIRQELMNTKDGGKYDLGAMSCEQ